MNLIQGDRSLIKNIKIGFVYIYCFNFYPLEAKAVIRFRPVDYIRIKLLQLGSLKNSLIGSATTTIR